MTLALSKPKSRSFWTRDQEGVVNRAEIDAGLIALDLGLNTRRYSVELKPASGGPAAWSGTWIRAGYTGSVSARLYRAADGGLVLVGDWSEDDTVYRWVAEFASKAL